MSIHPGDDELLDHALFGDPDVESHLAQCGDCRARAEKFAAEQRLLRDAHAPAAAPARLSVLRPAPSAWKWTAIAAMALLGLVSAAGTYAWAETRRLTGELAAARNQARPMPESAQLVSLRDSFRNIAREAQGGQWDENPRLALRDMELQGCVASTIADLASRMELTDTQVERLRRGLVVLFRSCEQEFDGEVYARKYREILSGALTPEQMKIVAGIEAEQAEQMRQWEIEFLVEELVEAVELSEDAQKKMQALLNERMPRRQMAMVMVDMGAMDALLDDADLAKAVRGLLTKDQGLRFDGYITATRKMREEFKIEFQFEDD